MTNLLEILKKLPLKNFYPTAQNAESMIAPLLKLGWIEANPLHKKLAEALAPRAVADLSVLIHYMLPKSSSVYLRDKSGSALLLDCHLLYFITLHLRFSQLFYGSGLTLITGVDILSGRTLLVYTYMTNLAEHLNLCTITTAYSNPGSIVELFLNASWYEREASELLGVKFGNSADTRTLLLPYNNTTNPLKKIMPSNSTSQLGYSRLNESLRWFQI